MRNKSEIIYCKLNITLWHDLKVPSYIFSSSSLYVLICILLKLANGLNSKLSVMFRLFYDINMFKMSKLRLYVSYVINEFPSLYLHNIISNAVHHRFG